MKLMMSLLLISQITFASSGSSLPTARGAADSATAKVGSLVISEEMTVIGQIRSALQKIATTAEDVPSERDLTAITRHIDPRIVREISENLGNKGKFKFHFQDNSGMPSKSVIEKLKLAFKTEEVSVQEGNMYSVVADVDGREMLQLVASAGGKSHDTVQDFGFFIVGVSKPYDNVVTVYGGGAEEAQRIVARGGPVLKPRKRLIFTKDTFRSAPTATAAAGPASSSPVTVNVTRPSATR